MSAALFPAKATAPSADALLFPLPHGPAAKCACRDEKAEPATTPVPKRHRAEPRSSASRFLSSSPKESRFVTRKGDDDDRSARLRNKNLFLPQFFFLHLFKKEHNIFLQEQAVVRNLARTENSAAPMTVYLPTFFTGDCALEL